MKQKQIAIIVLIAITTLITASTTSAQPHTEPLLYFDEAATSPVPLFHELEEHELYTFYIRSDNPGGANLTYYIFPLSELCELQDGETGRITCLVTHEILTGTTSPAPEFPINKTIRINADDQNDTIRYQYHDFTLIPVNDQAYFTTIISDQSTLSYEPWSLLIEGEDEETDYPLNFAVEWNYTGGGGDLIINSTGDKTAILTFNTIDNAPTNDHVGTWNVTINITDNGSSEFPPNTMNFNLEINFTFTPPYFTTNFTELEGMSWEQNTEFNYTVEAQDDDEGDILTFYLRKPDNSTCPVDFPWDETHITTINSSWEGAIAEIHVPNLTNDFVACREVEIVVEDNQGIPTAQYVFFNITNVNDPPVIHEVGIHGNMSEQQTHLYSQYQYQVNATDPDQLTYDINNTGILTYYTNNSLFPINSSTGLISVFPNDISYVGNWSINITVSDGEYNDSRIMELEILPNQVPFLNITDNNLAFLQNDQIEITFTSIEYTNMTMDLSSESLTGFNNSIYDFTVISQQEDDGVQTWTWLLNMTETNEITRKLQVGFHSIQITITDEIGASGPESTGTLNFTIERENDPPFFTAGVNTFQRQNISFPPMAAGSQFSAIIAADDYDFLLPSTIYNESLQFNYSNPSPGINNSITIDKQSPNTALISFTPMQEGEQYIMIRVTDEDGAYEEQNVTFTVYPQTNPPEITHVRPVQGPNGTINNTFTETSNFTGNITTFNLTVTPSVAFAQDCSTAIVDVIPGSLLFDAIIEEDNTTLPGNTLSLEWSVNNAIVKTIGNAQPGFNSSFNWSIDKWTYTTVNITLEAIDALGSASEWKWIINIQPENPGPSFCNYSLEHFVRADHPFGNLTHITTFSIEGKTTIPNYFSFSSISAGNNRQRFYHPLDDLNMDGRRYSDQGEPNIRLTYSVVNPGACSFADFSFEGDSLIISPKETGICAVRFRASDGEFTVESNEDTIVQVTEAEQQQTTQPQPRPVTTTTTMPVPFQEQVDVPAPIRIIIPSSAFVYRNRTIEVPVILENTWDEVIRGISLSATMTREENASFHFSNSFFSTMQPGANVTTTLTISDYRSMGPYQITVFAEVSDPEFNDSVSILVSGLEQAEGTGDDVRVLVTFARDLLTENRVCAELNELLDRADREFDNNNYEEARRIVDGVINGCRYLLSQDDDLRVETPGVLRRSFSFVDDNLIPLIVSAGILTLLTILFYMVMGIKGRLSKEE